MFLSTLRMQLKIILCKHSFQVVFSFILILCLLNTLYYAHLCTGCDVSTLPAASQIFILNCYNKFNEIFVNLYIYIALIPFSFSFMSERKRNFYPLIQLRSNVRIYYSSKLWACFIGTFILFFIPFIVELLLSALIFPQQGGLVSGLGLYTFNHTSHIAGTNVLINTVNVGIPMKRLYLNHPNLYNLIYAFIFSCFCGLIASLAMSLSFCIKKFNIVLFAPFFALTYLQQKLDVIMCNRKTGLYINFIMREYITIDSYFGLSLLYFLLLLSSFICITIILYFYQSRKDQLD